jgi:two-component system nitrogen regulation response regulator NtrX
MLIGTSKGALRIQEFADDVACSTANILLEGETGTGKGLLAALIHHIGRPAKKFVKVNCGNLMREMLDSVLFGHQKGAFTGANEQKKGFVPYADGGTLFLDEIGDLDSLTQAMVLSITENDGTYIALGGLVEQKVTARIISASNKDLPCAIAENRFRADLYYRLNVLPFTVPPLRERREDIPAIVEHFLDEHAKRSLKPDRDVSIKSFSPEAMSVLMEYEWPGNIRQLQNTVTNGIELSKEKIVSADHIRRYLKIDCSHKPPSRSSCKPTTDS